MPQVDQASERYSLWLLTLGPVIWMSHLLLCYGTASVWCGKFAHDDGPLGAVPNLIVWYTVVALAGLAFVGWEGYRRHRHEGGNTEATTHDLDTPEDRYRFLGFATLLLSGLSAVGVIYAGLVARYFDTCR